MSKMMKFHKYLYEKLADFCCQIRLLWHLLTSKLWNTGKMRTSGNGAEKRKSRIERGLLEIGNGGALR